MPTERKSDTLIADLPQQDRIASRDKRDDGELTFSFAALPCSSTTVGIAPCWPTNLRLFSAPAAEHMSLCFLGRAVLGAKAIGGHGPRKMSFGLPFLLPINYPASGCR